MVIVDADYKPDEWQRHETYYRTDYARWNGLVNQTPVLRQVIEIRAASVFSSWTIKGSHKGQAEKILNDMKGRNGFETFKQVMSNMYRIAYICGDSYAEKIYDGDPEDGRIIDLHILPSDNIRQVIKKGKIIRFEEIDGDAKWEPHRIFHMRYLPRGAMTHGVGMVEGLANTLISRAQIQQIGDEMYERMSRPIVAILANTADPTKLQQIYQAIEKAGDSWGGKVVMPHTLINDIKDIQLSVSLKPQEWIEIKDKEIFKATATPEIVLGTGYSTSEEDAKTRIAGFMGSIRYDQEDCEDAIYRQIFAEIWPSNPPTIELSYTAESFDAMFNREMDTIGKIDSSASIAPENKMAIIQEILEETGRVV